MISWCTLPLIRQLYSLHVRRIASTQARQGNDSPAIVPLDRISVNQPRIHTRRLESTLKQPAAAHQPTLVAPLGALTPPRSERESTESSAWHESGGRGPGRMNRVCDLSVSARRLSLPTDVQREIHTGRRRRAAPQEPKQQSSPNVHFFANNNSTSLTHS